MEDFFEIQFERTRPSPSWHFLKGLDQAEAILKVAIEEELTNNK